MLFDFELVPLDRIPPWENPKTGAKSLHWFGLTDGQYWMEAGDARLFEHTEQIRQLKGWTQFCDYQVARLHEDLMKILPYVLEAVPEDIAASYLSGMRGRAWQITFSEWDKAQPRERMEDDRYWTARDGGIRWVVKRTLDTMHLGGDPWITLWSDKETSHIEWDNSDATIDDQPMFTAIRGSYELPRERFIEEVSAFHDRLMSEMKDRIERVSAGALPADVLVNIPSFLKEQEEHDRMLAAALSGPEKPTDWEQVRSAIAEIEAHERCR